MLLDAWPREGFCPRYNHLGKLSPLPPPNQITLWLGENMPSSEGRWVWEGALWGTR